MDGFFLDDGNLMNVQMGRHIQPWGKKTAFFLSKLLFSSDSFIFYLFSFRYLAGTILQKPKKEKKTV